MRFCTCPCLLLYLCTEHILRIHNIHFHSLIVFIVFIVWLMAHGSWLEVDSLAFPSLLSFSVLYCTASTVETVGCRDGCRAGYQDVGQLGCQDGLIYLPTYLPTYVMYIWVGLGLR